jgi:thioesterase domain-containing protein
VRTTDAQVRKLMEEMAKHGRLGLAAARAGMDRKTARRYVKEGKFPSEREQERTWRTREDPFEEQWADLAERLKEAPELEAKTLFEELYTREPGRYKPGQLRTRERRVRQWRAHQGPETLVFFAQEHRPGEGMQTDFTWSGCWRRRAGATSG